MTSKKDILDALKKTINQEDQTQLQLKLQGNELKNFFPQVAQDVNEVEKKIKEQQKKIAEQREKKKTVPLTQ
ncbi:TPA: hypothetical protein HA249_06735 [Candidatus Woesearchaeota archaeon]|nr:MAG: hypothetical protein QT07_C0005G0018 [archaeon GW2011_AR16]HIG96551.1 hypothetical protein [Candidatus Woesearchaeota archaeon]HII88789.1 hypothetical protein [Candidatus Woesearchaeota archaeon]